MRAWLGILVLAAACACAEPVVNEYEPRTGIITGTILYPKGTARGNVIVLLFRSDMLPPPQGTSRPVNFIVVPAAQIFGDSPEGTAGDFAAPYTIPTVQPGNYQVRAFLDADGDFNPTQDLLAQPTALDVGGGHVNLDTFEFLPVIVEKDKTTAQITVTLGLVYPVERPAFAFTSTTTFTVPYARPQVLGIDAHPLLRPPIEMDPLRTAFLIQYADLDDDGEVDDTNGDHLPDVFPQVLLRRRPTAELPGTIVIPGIIDPFPYLDALAATGSAMATHLDVLLPPVSVSIAADGTRTIMPGVPAGTYDTIVISGTGQTWQVPNLLDMLVPPADGDTTQSETVTMVDGAPLPTGRIEGTVRVANDHRGDAYVIAFSATNPPPPVGTGRPVALASVPEASFVAAGSGSTVEAPFSIVGLTDGPYIVRGFVDVDGNFSPLQDLVAQPSAADFGGGSTPPVVVVSAGGATAGVTVELSTPVGFDRPSFELTSDFEIARTAFPATIFVKSHPLDVLGSTEATTKIPVALGMADEDGDNYRDLLPRVLLTKMEDAGDDERAVLDEVPTIVIPGIVDPISFVGILSSGIPAVPAGELRIILPPVALRLGSGGSREVLSPPPAGRYRVNILSATGQTWSVPSNLDLLLRRVGTPLEDPTQAQYVRVLDTPIPGGVIQGTISILGTAPAGDYSAIIFAFDKNKPPPPLGSGRPVAVAVVPKSVFGAGATAPYALRGLPAGTYTVRGFLDANDDFTPWYDVKNQPDAGDFGGGHLQLPAGTFIEVQVDALGGGVTNIDVSLLQAAPFTTDRPMFTLTATEAVMNPAQGPLIVTFAAVNEQSDVLHQNGVFPIRWVDLDANGTADDVNGDGNPDVFPLVVAQLLDADDESGETLDARGVRVPGIVNPLQFAAAGFPATDPMATSTTTPVTSMIVAFPPLGVDAMNQRVAPPDGRYRITVINARGQTWSIPNELVRAAGTALPMSQGKYLEVRR